MRISYDWLKKYVDVKLSAEKLADLLTMGGLSVESIEKFGNDYILEIEITANRPDWLSIIGVAREVAAMTGARLEIPAVTQQHRSPSNKKAKAVFIKVEDKKLCPRYTARLITDIKVAPSPAWLKARLEAVGLRSVNNIVDIINFCLFETGEPMHAFDFDKIAGGQIIVRKARSGEKITVIEGAEKTLDESVLVIADSDKPIAIAGVMGGLNTEVTESTKNILLEAAFFDPISIRRTCRKLGISTESSYRFERGVDPENIVCASYRALGLILELAGGQPGEFTDINYSQTQKRIIDLRPEKVNAVLGIDIPVERMKKILISLGIGIPMESKSRLSLQVPSFRNDLRYEIDIVEEISRIFGYQNIPSTIPSIVEQPVRMEKELLLRGSVRSAIAGAGCDEIITYSLLSRKSVASAGLAPQALVDIENPLTSEQEVMRPSLIPGMLGAMARNMNRKLKDLKLFEIGNIYLKKPGGEYSEKNHLCVGIAGTSFAHWASSSRQADFFELKGILERLFAWLGIREAAFQQTRHESFALAECASIEIGGRPIGVMGKLATRVLTSFDIKEAVYLAEMNLEELFKYVPVEKRFEELPRYPSVWRDISIIVAKETVNADILSIMKKTAGALLKDAYLIDRYSGKQVPEGKVSLTYRLEYQDPTRTLEEKYISDIHSKVLHSLEERFGAKLR
ncbi:MAG: phenylalanine--tRNA ligase subunit beta [Candidatus Omnitrophica bacterium]|nr:phenylalanine--tRNA ligase subunit beta [Candidatus Omnitrophota bacterium]